MVVHGMSTSQELVEVLIANIQAYAQANGTPDTVSATNPVREGEHVLGVNAELADFRTVGGKSNEVLCNSRVVLGLLEEPFLCRVGVCDGLGSGEGLGRDEEEGGLWIGLAECFSDVGSVDVGDEVEGEVSLSVWLESFGDHDGAAVICC